MFCDDSENAFHCWGKGGSSGPGGGGAGGDFAGYWKRPDSST